MLGIGLRVAFAARKGWVLDEFHTDYHAQRATLGLLLEGLVQDNHPPLSFLLVRLAGLGLGTSTRSAATTSPAAASVRSSASNLSATAAAFSRRVARLFGVNTNAGFFPLSPPKPPREEGGGAGDDADVAPARAPRAPLVLFAAPSRTCSAAI